MKYTRPPSHSSSGSEEKSAEDGQGEVIEIDFSRPWPRYSMVEELEKRGDFKIPRPLDGEECAAFLKEKCPGKYLYTIFSEFKLVPVCTCSVTSW